MFLGVAWIKATVQLLRYEEHRKRFWSEGSDISCVLRRRPFVLLLSASSRRQKRQLYILTDAGGVGEGRSAGGHAARVDPGGLPGDRRPRTHEKQPPRDELQKYDTVV